MSRGRLTVVLSQAPGKHPAKRSLEESIALVLRYVEALNTGDLAALDELFADDFLIHQPSGDRRGKGAIRGFVAGVRRTLPDIEARSEAICDATSTAAGSCFCTATTFAPLRPSPRRRPVRRSLPSGLSSASTAILAFGRVRLMLRPYIAPSPT